MSLTITIAGLTISPPAGEWGWEKEDLGVSIPVISGFTPAVVGRSSGFRGERGSVTHLERNASGGSANYEAIMTTIQGMIDTLMPDPPGLGYHDAVFPTWSGRVRILRCSPRFGRVAKTAYAYLTIDYERVKG